MAKKKKELFQEKLQGDIHSFQKDLEQEEKKRNSPQKNYKEEILKKLTPEEREKIHSLERYPLGKTEKRYKYFLVGLLILLFVGGVYFFLFSKKEEPRYSLYLSHKRITPQMLPQLEKQPEKVFSKNMPIFIYFQSPTPISSKKIFIHIYKKTPQGEKLLWEFQRDIPQGIRKIETYFQEEFFEEKGEYILALYTEEKKLLIKKSFQVE